MTTTAAVTGTQVYQMYINAPQQKVWEAITTPEIVAAYFRGAQVQGSYQPGTKIRMASPDGTQEWGNNTVLEADPPRKLVHTWRSLYDPEMAAEPESRVTWEIESLPGGYSRLTLIHDQLDASPKTAASITGWTYYLSSLKSVLETGSPLPPPPSDS
ncbi:MAG: Activator of Hsp90 ATPase 1 family protein [Actinomycetia bacterium]|nr:Activator of Hsp90 ATPase 1 family protein [Actinomycetes bacterium]